MAADQILLELSANKEKDTPFVNQNWNYILDQGSGNYSSGQSTLDTSSLANNAAYLDPKSLTLAIPLAMRVKASQAASDANTAPLTMAFKNWYGQIIHYLTVDLNSTNIIQQTPYLNVFQHFKLMTTLSYDDVRKDGSLCGFYPDSSDSWSATATAATTGIGITNNVDYLLPSSVAGAAAAQGPVLGNKGLLQRQLWISYDPSAAPRSLVASAAQLNQILKSYIATTSTSEIIYRFIAIIPLYQLNGLFNELPLMKGAFFRFLMQFNQVNMSCGAMTTAAAVYPTMTVTNPYGGATNPCMLTNRAANNGANGMYNNAAPTPGTYTFECRVGSTPWSDGTANASNLSQVRLYYRLITMTPADEAAYIANAVHRVRYRDLYQYTISNVAGGANVTQLLWNSVPRTRELLMVPLAVAGQVAATAPHQLQTPFDSSPATTCPMAHITNLQVNLSGTSLYSQPINYGFSEFLQELRRTGVNFGQTPGLSSGLIGYEDFMNNYAYVYVNLDGYCLPSMDDIGKSVQVSFTSQSALTLDFLCFCAYERELEINVLSGAIVSYK
jgi:hypothetical protein